MQVNISNKIYNKYTFESKLIFQLYSKFCTKIFVPLEWTTRILILK